MNGGRRRREYGTRDPAMYPHIRQVGEDWYQCTQYGGKFDAEAFDLAGGCPVCSSVGEAQENIFGGL